MTKGMVYSGRQNLHARFPVNSYDGDALGRPWLVFNDDEGVFVIADDYETSNDKASRAFDISKSDALRLAKALIDYACAEAREPRLFE